MYHVGIDEAGRGPVLGSLIYCAAFWPLSEHEEICKLGFDDSKQLKESDRDNFFQLINSHPSIGWVIEELSAEKISEDMMRVNPISLNAISYDAVIRILERIKSPLSSDTDTYIPVNSTLTGPDCLDPPVIGSLMFGAERTLPSRTMANSLPMF